MTTLEIVMLSLMMMLFWAEDGRSLQFGWAGVLGYEINLCK